MQLLALTSTDAHRWEPKRLRLRLFLPRLHGEHRRTNIALADRLRPIGDRLGASIAQLAIAWVLAPSTLMSSPSSAPPVPTASPTTSPRHTCNSARSTSPTSSTPSPDPPSPVPDTPHRSWPCWTASKPLSRPQSGYETFQCKKPGHTATTPSSSSPHREVGRHRFPRTRSAPATGTTVRELSTPTALLIVEEQAPQRGRGAALRGQLPAYGHLGDAAEPLGGLWR